MPNENYDFIHNDDLSEILAELRLMGYRDSELEWHQLSYSGLITELLPRIQVAAHTRKTYLERHYGEEHVIEYVDFFDPERAWDGHHGTKFTMGSRSNNSTKEWHLCAVTSVAQKGSFEVLGITPADLLLTHVVHCLWRRLAARKSTRLSKTNPLGDIEAHKSFFEGVIHEALCEHMERYGDLGGRSFKEISPLEAQHISDLKLRLEIENKIGRNWARKYDHKARITFLKDLLRLKNQQLTSILSVIIDKLWFYYQDNEDGILSPGGDHSALLYDVFSLSDNAHEVVEVGSGNTAKARTLSAEKRTQQSKESLSVLVSICDCLLAPDEQVFSVFLDANQRAKRDNIVVGCFWSEGEQYVLGEQTHWGPNNNMSFKWDVRNGKHRKLVKDTNGGKWVKAFRGPSVNTPPIRSAFPFGSFWDLLEKIDETRGFPPRTKRSTSTPERDTKETVEPIPTVVDDFKELIRALQLASNS